MAAIMLAHFKVQDEAKWRQVFESKMELRKGAGCLGTHIFHNASDPTEIIVNFQWDTAENATRFMAGPEARQAMAEAGVIGAPQTWILTDGGRTPS
jgi:heme-degrading monooxygenase HmoA